LPRQEHFSLIFN